MKSTNIDIHFSDGLNPATVGNLANYRLVAVGRDKKFGTKDDVLTPLGSVSYDPNAHPITLKMKKTMFLKSPLQHRITAAGLLDRLNHPIDGNRDKVAGGDAVGIVSKSGVALQSVSTPAAQPAIAARAIDHLLATSPRQLAVRKKK